MYDGVLLIDKPKGWTSFDVVNKVRGLLQSSMVSTPTRKKRLPVGHTGTLDPLATGLLVLLIGRYTKEAPSLTKLDKTYDVVMRLGEVTTTGDEEGEKTHVSTKQPSSHDVQQALQQFEGDFLQTPPIYSAIKVNGRRAYKLARQGEVPKLPPRPVHVSSIALDNYQYPLVSYTAHVSSGTYIRSLVVDIGEVLATGAYMSDLRRTKVGPFSLADAIPIQGMTPEKVTQNLRDISGIRLTL